METLLLTATVDPGPTPVLRLRDPRERLVHYVASLLAWSKDGPFDQIVICENSGNGRLFEGLRGSISRKLEIITFPGNEESWTFGKGRGEGRILEKAFTESEAIRESDYVWKATGRIFVQNAARLMALHRWDPNVIDHGDTRYFKVSVPFFKERMIHLYRDVNDHKGVSIEVAYRRALEKESSVVPFLEPKDYIGQDAGSGNWHRPFPEDLFSRARRIAEELPLGEPI